MKQRVVIAIALACEPKLLLADEPTTALDVTIQAQVLNMMRELKNKLNTAMILITHDLGVVAENCDSVAIMYAGEIVESGADVYKRQGIQSLPLLYTDRRIVSFYDDRRRKTCWKAELLPVVIRAIVPTTYKKGDTI